MKPELLLYSRSDCCLCNEMKRVIHSVGERIPLTIVEVDVDGSAEMAREYGNDVPVLFEMRTNVMVNRYTDRAKMKTVEEAVEKMKTILDMVENRTGIAWARDLRASGLRTSCRCCWSIFTSSFLPVLPM